MKKISRIVSLLLTFVLVFSMISLSPVRAAEVPPAEESASTSETDAAEPEEYQAETVPEETLAVDSSLFTTRATYENGKYRQRAVVWNTVGEKVNYTYNGKDNSYNILLMHTLWYNGAWRAAYCIEPGATVYVNSDYDEVENSGVDPWGQLDYAKQRGVGLALLYGYPNGIDSSDLKTQIAYQLATYLIIHEIILGWRQDTHPFTRTNDHYFDVFGGGTPDDPEALELTSEYYSEVHTKHLNNEDVWYAYNHISNSLATHDLIPSFAAYTTETAPTHTMQSNGDGTYSITLTDSNNILSAYDFTNTADLTFTKSADGKSLTIRTSNANLGTVAVDPTRIVPSIENSAYLIWNAETNSQELCTLKGAQSDPVPAFFKLKLPTGGVNIQKETSDNGCLSGWQFDIYGDEACTSLISGPHTTNANGQASVSGLVAGTYWIKETGNVSAEVTGMYTCMGNPQQVTVVAGETSTVIFLNNLIPKGRLEVTKDTDSGVDTMGWRFALYAEESCQTLLYGPVATDPYGVATFTDLYPGTYWLKEIGNNNPEMVDAYTCISRNPQPVTIISDETATVTFYNKMNTGAITVYKTDAYDTPLPGAHFLLEWSVSGSIWNPVTYSATPGWGKCTTSGLQNGVLVTDSSGYATFQGLPLGVYYRLTEVKAPNGYQLLEGYAYEGMLTKDALVATVHVVNTPVFTLPHTGSRSMLGITTGLVVCLLTCAGAIYYLRRKEG